MEEGLVRCERPLNRGREVLFAYTIGTTKAVRNSEVSAIHGMLK